MSTSKEKFSRILLGFAGLAGTAALIILLTAFTHEPQKMAAALPITASEKVDDGSAHIFNSYTAIPDTYLAAGSTDRTLAEFYSRRQYPGAPPLIPHAVEDVQNEKKDCLACHEKGGFAVEMNRFSPLTPHPEQINCRQCHVHPITAVLFMETNWQLMAPPLLGRSHLPGAPPPIPHALQMRENCIACHAGPGAVTEIRVEHASRGNCRQCHVPDEFKAPFERKTTVSAAG